MVAVKTRKLKYVLLYVHTYVCTVLHTSIPYLFLYRIYGEFDEFGNFTHLREYTLTEGEALTWKAQAQGIASR